MDQTQQALDLKLDSIQAGLPLLMLEHADDAEFWAAFSKLQTGVEAEAGPHLAHVRERINCMLGSFGLIPSDNEGEPCP